MRYLKTLLVVLFAFVGTTSFAQDTEKKGDALGAGTYYLYNVGTKQFLCASANWDTHAALERVPAQQIFISENNGAYRLGTHAKGDWNNYLGQDGTDPWMDKNPSRFDCDFTFEEAEDDGYVAYYIKHAAGYLAGDANHQVYFKSEKNQNAMWVLYSLDGLNQALEGSVPEEGVEATHLIQNAGFQRVSQFGLEKWTITSSGGNVARGPSWGIAQTQEFWNNTFEISQTLSNVPNGRYTFRVQGFNRINNNPEQTSPNDAFYYANDTEANLMPIGVHSTQYSGDYAVGDKWATNSQGGAGDYMLDGGYQNGFITFDVTDNTIKVGAKRSSQEGVCWTVLDNFELKFMGNEPLLKELIDKANELLPDLEDRYKPALEEAIAAAQEVLDNNGNQEEVKDALQALQDAYDEADALNVAKKLAQQVLNDYDHGKYAYAWKEEFVDPLRKLLEKCDSGEEFDSEEMVEELTYYARGVVTTHSWAAQLYLQGDDHVKPDAGYDWMWTFDEDFSRWTNEGWGEETLSDEPMTDYDGYQPLYIEQESEEGFTADVYQEFYLPAGRYILTVTGRGTANAFTEVGAQDPAKYFQVYAVNDQGVDRRMSIPTVGFGKSDGVFGYGWNDASIMFNMKSEGYVRLGARAATDMKGKASVSNFRLARMGDATLYFNEYESYGDKLGYMEVYNDYVDWAWIYDLFYGEGAGEYYLGYENCPADVLLHKTMEAGKWYSISVPASISEAQLEAQFGEGTRLAWPVYGYDVEGLARVVNYWSWDISDPDDENRVTDGIWANLPYLIKPAKTKASNRYSFNDVAVCNDPNYTYEYWPLGLSKEEDLPADYLLNSLVWLTDDENHVTFHVNYDYRPSFPEYYTVEFCDTLKSFTAYMTTDGEEEILVLVDDEFDVLNQQINDAIALGQQKAEWYPGIPAAMTKKLTTIPAIETVADAIGAVSSIRSAIQEAQKAYEPSKEFNALMAKAEELLNSDHNELVEGADAAFKKKIEQLQKRFDMQLKAEPIYDLIESLKAAIAEYKEQIFIAGTIETGKYILQNVATGKFFNGGNSWGTRSSLVDHPEYMLLTKLDDGTHRLESRQNNGGEQFYFGPNYYVDNGTPMPLTFTPVAEGIYTITCTGESGTGLLGYDGSTTVLSGTLTDAKSADAQWYVISEEKMEAMMAEASLENPVDATFFIKDANFSRNHRDADAWVWETENHNIAGDNTNFCAESWTHTFVLSQALELPNGVYMLNAQAALTDYTNAYDKRDDYPVVYAGDETVKFCEMEEADRATSMSQLSNSFSAGKYFVDPVIVEVTDGKLTIGAKCNATDYWCIFDNFSLTYFADADIDAVRAAYPKNTGATTGINEVNTGVNTGAIYNLNGVRVKNMNQKGVYIVNGKKVTK